MTLVQAAWVVLVAARILPSLLLIPAFGPRRLPLPVVIVLALLVAGSLAEASGYAGTCPGGIRWLGLLMKELCVGLVLACLGNCLFAAAGVGGELSDQLRGANKGANVSPWADGRASPMALLHGLLACGLFFLCDGPVIFTQALIRSFAILPVDCFNQAGEVGPVASLAIALVEQALDVGLWIAMPVLIAVLTSDVLLGFLNRSAPQMQVYFLGLPAKAILGLGAAILGLQRAAWLFSTWEWWSG